MKIRNKISLKYREMEGGVNLRKDVGKFSKLSEKADVFSVNLDQNFSIGYRWVDILLIIVVFVIVTKLAN